MVARARALASPLQPVSRVGSKGPSPVEGSEIITGIKSRDLQFRPSITGWTPDLVAAAGAQADLGNLTQLADLVDAMMSDDHIEGVLQSLTLGTFGLPLQYEGGSSALTALLRGTGTMGAGGEWNSMHPEPELRKLYNWGAMLGIGLGQRKPLPRLLGQEQRFRLKVWHPRFLNFDHEGSRGFHWGVQTRAGIKPVIPGGQFFLYLPFGEMRPWNDGKWRSCAFPWLVKRFSLEDRANQGEVVGSPTWVGSSTQGGTEKQRLRFLSQLTALGRNGRIVLPDGWSLDLKEAKGRTWEIFSESSDWADAAITVAIISQAVTTNGSPGFTSGKEQGDIKADVTRYFAKSFSLCLYENSTKPWARVNTGDETNAPCGYWNTERTNSQASTATTFETIGRALPELDAALARSGKMVDADQLMAAFGVPTKSDAGAKPLVQPPTPSRTPPKPPGQPGPPGSQPELPV